MPTFSGDPLEWVNYKRAYYSSSELGNYSNSENMSRLFESLKDNARDALKAHFVAGSSNCDVIMETLEMRFGNPRVIL